MNVESWMTPDPVSCHPEDRDDEAARKLWETDCGVLPVVGADGRVVGLITDRDLCMSAYTKGRQLGEMQVSEAMSSEVEGCAPGDDLERALRRMAERRVRRLPVLDERQRLVGVLSLNDVFRHVAELPEGKEKARLTAATMRSMATICAPREATQVSR